MKKFNKLFVAHQTKVQLPSEYGYRLVTEIHKSRKWIKIDGLVGDFQREHILSFTNKPDVGMFPSLDDLYRVESGSVYEKRSDACYFIGKLNGLTLRQFVKEYNKQA